MYKQLIVTKTLVTGLSAEKARVLADEAGVSLKQVETRFAGGGKWVNEFEASGSPGKVDKFFARVDEIRVD